MSIKKNTAWNFAGSIAPMLLGVVTIPYLMRSLGVEAFGILTLVWALIGYFSVFDFGVGRALTQQVSAFRAGDSACHDLAGIVRSGLVLISWFGLAGGLILAALAYPLGHHWLNVDPPLRSATTRCLLIAALGIPLTTIVTGLRGVLEGYEDFPIANLLKIVLGCATFGLPALTVWVWGPSLAAVVASLVAARLVILFAHGQAVARHVAFWRSASGAAAEQVKSLLSFGVWMTMSNIISPLMVTADRFIISFIAGAAAVAYYTVPFDFILRLLVVPAALTSTLFPRFASLATGPADHFLRIYRRGLLAVLCVMLPVCVVLVFGSHLGLSLWLGEAFAARAWVIASVLAVGLLFNGLAQIPHAALQSCGGVRATALLHLGEFVVYAPLLYFSLLSFGLVGAAVAWSARVFADFAILLVLVKRRVR
jgi:O-antigen/teichoic acid export membrane protein